MFVNARSPSSPPPNLKQFGHAVSGLISNRRQGDKFECDEILLVEATGPVNPIPAGVAGGIGPGIIANTTSNERSQQARERLCRLLNVEHLRKGTITVPGIRAHDNWLYDGLYVLMTSDAAYIGDNGQMPKLECVLAGEATLRRVKCCCTAGQLAEKELQLALLPRCYRTADQTPQTADDPYAKGIVPVGYGNYIFISGAGDDLDGIVNGGDSDVVVCKWNVDRLRRGNVVAFGAAACDVSVSRGGGAAPGSML